jgi:hypothetical protein
MALANFTELSEAVPRFAMRSGDEDFENSVADFIGLAERRMSRQLRTRFNENTISLTVTDGVATLPADYAQFRDVVFNGACRINLGSVSPGYGIQADPSHVAGTPRFFSISGNELTVYPTWSGDLVFTYYSKIPALSDSNPTNWALDNYPDLYLYGALLEAAPFMMDDQRMATWGQLYNSAMSAANEDDTLSRYARVSARVSGPTP